jgi:hypothetical protein
VPDPRSLTQNESRLDPDAWTRAEIQNIFGPPETTSTGGREAQHEKRVALAIDVCWLRSQQSCEAAAADRGVMLGNGYCWLAQIVKLYVLQDVTFL